jgi:hypothetical protein
LLIAVKSSLTASNTRTTVARITSLHIHLLNEQLLVAPAKTPKVTDLRADQSTAIQHGTLLQPVPLLLLLLLLLLGLLMPLCSLVCLHRQAAHPVAYPS